jgi:hypothetical protein
VSFSGSAFAVPTAINMAQNIKVVRSISTPPFFIDKIHESNCAWRNPVSQINERMLGITLPYGDIAHRDFT